MIRVIKSTNHVEVSLLVQSHRNDILLDHKSSLARTNIDELIGVLRFQVQFKLHGGILDRFKLNCIALASHKGKGQGTALTTIDGAAPLILVNKGLVTNNSPMQNEIFFIFVDINLIVPEGAVGVESFSLNANEMSSGP